MKIKIRLTKSPIGYAETQRKTLQALGLNKVGSVVIHEDSPSIQGMIHKCAHLLTVEAAE